MFDLALYLGREGATAQGHEVSQQVGLSNWEDDGGPGGGGISFRKGERLDV